MSAPIARDDDTDDDERESMMRRRVHGKRETSVEADGRATLRPGFRPADGAAIVAQRSADGAATVQRASLDEEEPLQGRFDVAQRASVDEEELQLRQAPPRNATGLPDGLKAGVESLSGVSLDDVRVHYNSAQPAQLNALAFAQGTDIHVAPGQERHLPHEAWHVVQQAQGRVKPTVQLQQGVPVNDDEALEHEADTMGAKAVAAGGGAVATIRGRGRPPTRLADAPAHGMALIQGQWDFRNPNLATTATITPLDNRGIALLFTDAAGDRLVVKASETPPDLERMVSTVYREVGGFSVPEAVDLTPNVAAVQALIVDATKSTANDWTKVAPLANMIVNANAATWWPQTLAWVAANFGAHPRPYVQGTPFAAGTRTEDLATGQGAQGQRFLQLFTSPAYMVQLGRLAAFDVFVGNGDRVLAGNLGNWFTHLPATTVADLIDNADHHARATWSSGQPAPPQIGGNITADIGCLSANRVAATAHQIAFNLANGARISGGFPSQQARTTWLNTVNAALGGTNWEFMEEALQTGMEAARDELRTKLVGQKMNPVGREVKARSTGLAAETGDDWWEMIKARARSL